MMQPIDIAGKFSPVAENLQPLGNGHINDTYLVYDRNNPFVLQKINSRVFPKPELMMANLDALNQHVEKTTGKDCPLTIPKLLPVETGGNFFKDDNGEVWRALTYIENSESLETIVNPWEAEQVGIALGQFHCLTRDLDAGSLFDTLPGFHIAPGYLAHYRRIQSLSSVPAEPFCSDFIERYQHIVDDLESAKVNGLLTVRTIHGDPKLNNFLFDKGSRHIVGIVDLDTVKPGLIHYDIGDCLRSCCHDLETNAFDLKTCGIILTAYLKEMGAYFTESDYEYLYPAIRLIPFELGLRFYTDYLEGNRYFKVSEPDENLHRAIGQFHLCDSVIAQETGVKCIIKQAKVTSI